MSLNTLPADRLPAIRTACAVDVRTSPATGPVQAVAQRRNLGPAEWFFAFVIVFMSAGALATTIL